MLKQRFVIYGLFACLVIMVSYQLLSNGSEQPAEVKDVMKDAIRQLESFDAFATPQLSEWNGRDPFELSSKRSERPAPPAARTRPDKRKEISTNPAVLPKPGETDYQLIAILSLDGEWSAYVRVGDQGMSVKQGDSVEGEFKVLSVGPAGILIKEERNERVTRIELPEESKQ